MPEVTSNPQRLDPIANSNPKLTFASRGSPPKVRDQKHVSFSLAIFLYAGTDSLFSLKKKTFFTNLYQ